MLDDQPADGLLKLLLRPKRFTIYRDEITGLHGRRYGEGFLFRIHTRTGSYDPCPMANESDAREICQRVHDWAGVPWNPIEPKVPPPLSSVGHDELMAELNQHAPTRSGTAYAAAAGVAAAVGIGVAIWQLRIESFEAWFLIAFGLVVFALILWNGTTSVLMVREEDASRLYLVSKWGRKRIPLPAKSIRSVDLRFVPAGNDESDPWSLHLVRDCETWVSSGLEREEMERLGISLAAVLGVVYQPSARVFADGCCEWTDPGAAGSPA